MAWHPELGKSPKKLADELAEIYEKAFGGKKRGRFRTSRKNFRRLARLPLITEEYIREVSLFLRLRKLILIDIDSAFCVIPLRNTRGYRRVTKSVIEEYLDDG